MTPRISSSNCARSTSRRMSRRTTTGEGRPSTAAPPVIPAVIFQSRLQRQPLKYHDSLCQTRLQSWSKWCAETVALPKAAAIWRSVRVGRGRCGALFRGARRKRAAPAHNLEAACFAEYRIRDGLCDHRQGRKCVPEAGNTTVRLWSRASRAVRLRASSVVEEDFDKSLQSTLENDTGYNVSLRIRKRIEEAFGWAKTVAGLRKARHRGLPKIDWQFTFAMAAYNLVRLPKLLGAGS